MTLVSHQTLNLQTRFTAQLAQTVRMLQLATPELAALVSAELAHNPALEMRTVNVCQHCGRRLKTLACPICDRRPAATGEPIVYLAARARRAHDAGFTDEIELPAPETLADYLWRQIGPGLRAEDQALAAEVLASLDEQGFLSEPLETFAERLSVPLARVCHVVQLIQQADPPGVGASDVRESLLLQLDSLDSADQQRDLARTLLSDHWQALRQNQLKPLARQLQVAASDLEAALHFIRCNLTPYPALAYWHSRIGPAAVPVYAEPDAIIHAPPAGRDEPFSIELFSPVAGWLRVSDRFKAALDDCPEADRPRLAECVKQAELLVRGLEQRTSTLQRLLAVIVREQSAYLLGRQPDPKPLTRAQLARQLDLHESTISRAVASKIVALPDGRLVPLESFFDQTLAARHALKAIVAAERRPLSDDELTQALSQLGYSIARRTVAKYREIERIPPASERNRSKTLMPG